VTLSANNVSFAACGANATSGAPPPFPALGVPTLPQIGEWGLFLVLLSSGAYVVTRRTRATSGQ
jgi:hypothetical protein